MIPRIFRTLFVTIFIFIVLLFETIAQNTPTLLPPTITNATQISSTKLKFDVTPSASPATEVNGYEMIVTENGNGFRNGGATLTGNSYEVSSLVPGRTYCLSMRTRGYSNNYSEYSNSFCGTTTNTLKEPTLTTTQNFTSSVVKVNFTPNPNNVFESTNTGFHFLYYKKTGEDYDENRRVFDFKPYNYFAFTTAQAGVEYCFKAKAAENTAISDLYSNEICATTVNSIRTPTLTSIEKLPASKLKLNWSTTYTNPLIYSRFELYMKTDNGAFVYYHPTNNLSNDVFYANTNSLPSGHSYTFRVRIVDDGGNVGAWSNELTETITNNLQPPIINTVTQLETDKININFNASSTPITDFAYYELWYSKNAGTTWEKNHFWPTGAAIENGTISSLNSPNNYCVKIRAANGSTYSPFSNEICIEIVNLLTPPTITSFTQEPGTTALKVIYSPSDLPANQVDNYKVYLTKNGVLQNSNLNYISYNPINIYSLEAGYSYCVKMVSLNSPNESPASNEMCIDLVNTLTPPQITSIEQISSSKLKIFWTNANVPANTGNLKYRFYKSEDGGLNFIQLGNTAQLNENSIEITNLITGKNYCFKMSTSDDTNYSAFSNSMCRDLVNTLPIPTLTSATNISTGKVKVEFSLPAGNIEPFQYYLLYYSIDGAPFNNYTYFSFQKTTDNFFIVNNLLPGKNYCFKLASNDYPNISPNSNEICIVPINTLTTPSITSISPVSSSKMKVFFTPPNQSADVLYYKLYYKASSNSTFQQIHINQFLTNYTVTGLIAGVEYCFKLKAFMNEDVFSSESALECGQTVNNLLPPTPTSIAQNNSNSFLVNFQASPNSQTEFDYYIVIRNENGGDYLGLTSVDKALLQANIYNLTTNKTYCFKFSTVDGPNTSIYSAPICGTLLNTLLPPAISSVEQVLTDNIKVTIVPPTNAGTNNPQYKLYQNIDGGPLQFYGYLSNNQTIVYNLTMGKNTCFKVLTTDGINNSAFSGESCIVPVNNLLPPTITTVEAISSNSLKINFTLPQNYTSNQYFEIYKKQTDGTFAYYNGFYPSNNTSYTFTGIAAGVNNCFKIKAREGQHLSDFSNEICGQTVNDLVVPTLNSVVQIDTKSQRITWTKNNTSTRTDLRYEIMYTVDGNNYFSSGTSSSTTSINSNITAGQNYCYKVRETDGVNYSAYSNEICLINTNNLLPPTPIAIDRINSHTIKLTWATPNSNFYEYKIYRNKADGSFENIAFAYQNETILYNIKAGENFCLKLKTYDGINYSDFSVPICATITNTLLPPTITSVSQTLSSRQVVNWSHSTTFSNEFDFYKVYKTIDGGSEILIATVHNFINQITDYKAIDGKSNCYKITIFDGYNESPFSAEVCNIPINDLVPPTISNIAKHQTRSIKFDIQNHMPNNQQFSYSIYVSTNGGNYVFQEKIENAYNYTYYFGSAKIGNNYCFKVIMGDFTTIANSNLNESNLSGYSNELCYTITDPLPKPSIIEITQTYSQNQISFNYDFEKGFINFANIYRSSDGVTYTKINNGYLFLNYYQTTSYVDNNVAQNQNYCYKIELFDGINFSEKSNLFCFPINTCESVKSGDWSDTSVWSCNKTPTITDQVVVLSGHIISVSANYTAFVKNITNNGTIDLGLNSIISIKQ